MSHKAEEEVVQLLLQAFDLSWPQNGHIIDWDRVRRWIIRNTARKWGVRMSAGFGVGWQPLF